MHFRQRRVSRRFAGSGRGLCGPDQAPIVRGYPLLLHWFQVRVAFATTAKIVVGIVLAGGVCRAYEEAPVLAARVAAGELPAVDERLPADPLVVEPVEGIGRYGGTWRRLAVLPSDSLLGSRLGYEPLARWDRDGRTVVPGLAASWEITDGGRTYTFHLRRGLKWSDGHPFTSADFVFWYEKVVSNAELTPVFPTSYTPRGSRFVVEGPDPETVVFRFQHPHALFLEIVAYRGASMYRPEHYLRDYHIEYFEGREEELQEKVDREKFDLWFELYRQVADLHLNPDLPTMCSWQIKVPPPKTRFLAERNPYYWKVDPAGNQLPYIDEVTYTLTQNKELLNLKALTGGVDMQARYIDSSMFTLYMENRTKGKYRVVADTSPGSICIYINQESRSKDPAVRKLLQDRRFRIALSVAINRPEIVELVYSGLATPTNAVSSEFDPYFPPGAGNKHTQYDPELAERLLDQVGMRRKRHGKRRLPGGGRFRPTLNYYPAETGTGDELWQLVGEYWREVGLDFVVKSDARVLSSMRVRNGNTDFWAYGIAGMHWVVDPLWYVAVSPASYHAPLYGSHYATRGKVGVEPREEFKRIIAWYEELASCYGNEERKLELGRQILSQWADQCYIIGIVRRTELAIVADRFRNFPPHLIQNYRIMTPGYMCPEQFYIEP